MPQPALEEQAKLFAEFQSTLPVPELVGVTDGKAVGTHIERAFNALQWRLQYSRALDKAGTVSGITRVR